MGDRLFSPEEISSFILRELKLEGERELGQTISKAVITVPALIWAAVRSMSPWWWSNRAWSRSKPATVTRGCGEMTLIKC